MYCEVSQPRELGRYVCGGTVADRICPKNQQSAGPESLAPLEQCQLDQAVSRCSCQRHSPLPQAPPASVEEPHDEWQLDAQGITPVADVGKICLINTVDVVSRVKVESYPSVGVINPPPRTTSSPCGVPS